LITSGVYVALFITVSTTAAKPPGGETDHSPPSTRTAEIKNERKQSHFGSSE